MIIIFSFFYVGNTRNAIVPVVWLPQQPVGIPVQFFCDFWQNEHFGYYMGVESPEGLWLRVQDSVGKSRQNAGANGCLRQ